MTYRAIARNAALATLLAAAFANNAAATPLPAYPTVDPGPSATSWYTDRFTPSGFSNAGSLFGRNNVLDIAIASADALPSRAAPFQSNFYNTQGRKIDIDAAPPVSWIGSAYIPASWASPPTTDSTGSRRTDMWATLVDGANAATVFPIIGFSNSQPDGIGNDFYDAPGGTARLRVYDAGWVNLATPVNYDGWNDFCVTYTGTSVEYRVGDTLVHTIASVGTSVLAADVMLQAYNFSSTTGYSANWSHVGFGSGNCAQLRAEFAPAPALPPQIVPVGPYAPLVAALGIALAALRLRRR